MKTYQHTTRPTTDLRRRQITAARRQPEIATGQPTTARQATDIRRVHATHDFLALCLYPGMSENHTAA